MPTRKIDEPSWADAIRYCQHPDHNPPTHRVFEPGEYEHECPNCGKKIRFSVPRVTL